MGLRFRRSFRIVPGWRINLSKSGISTSFGRRGAWFTVGPRGTRETLGIPGTGISWTEQQSPRGTGRKPPAESDEQRVEGEVNLFRGIVFIAMLIGIVALIAHFSH